MSDSAYTRKLKLFERAQAGVNLLLNKENQSVFISDGDDLSKPKNGNLDMSVCNNSASFIQRTGSSRGRPPDTRSAIVLKGRRVIKKKKHICEEQTA